VRFGVGAVARLGGRYVAFADVESGVVRLSRLLRVSLFQVSVGMALVLMLGTLNRVMSVELDVPASLVAVMISLPILFAPLRALIGFKSDNHRSALGLRRFPYIYRGTLLQFGGFAVMPFALLVLSGYGEAIDAPRWIGLASAAVSFLLVGAGVHMVQTVGLALATDLVPEDDQPKVVGLMYVMLLFGMVGSALIFGWLLSAYTPGRLIQVIQGAAVVTVVLNTASIWKQEALDRTRANTPQPVRRFRTTWAAFARKAGAVRLLVVVAFGTLAFGMADVLLEPYGGQVLAMSVSQTTKLTAVLAFGTLLGFGMASRVLGRGGRPVAMCGQGALFGVPGFAMIIAASQWGWTPLFIAGTALC